MGVFIALSFGVLVLTVLAYVLDPRLFDKFLGRLNPVATIILLALVGGGFLAWLLRRGWFAIWTPGDPGRFLAPVAIAALMAATMILLDVKVVFPRDLNISWPYSLLSYPVIDYAVQVLFHIVPLSLLLFLLTPVLKSYAHSDIIWLCIFLVAALEPILQATFFAGQYPTWIVAFIGLLIYVCNLVELALFERFDFVTMYSFRLSYYMVWHVVWGYARLRLLFKSERPLAVED